MNVTPYRTKPNAHLHRYIACDLDLLPAFVILWVASLARVLYATATAEPWGPEATLAALSVLLVPLLVLGRRGPEAREGKAARKRIQSRT